MSGAPANLPGRWESGLLPLPATGVNIAVRAAHGRGLPPREMRWVLVCLAVGEFGYVPGDEIDVVNYNATVPPTTWANAAEVGFTQGANTWALQMQAKAGGGGAIVALTNTATRWALKCYCTW